MWLGARVKAGECGCGQAAGRVERAGAGQATHPALLLCSLPPLPRAGFPEWLAKLRALCFYVTTFVFATPLFCLMLLVYPAVLAFDKYR